MTERINERKPFDVSALSIEDDFAREFGALLKGEQLPPIEYAPAKYRKKEPVAKESPTIDVQSGHELAAAALDELGKEIIERVKKIEEIKKEGAEQLATCRELAERYRDAGKLMSAQIEMAQADLAESRQVIEELRKKIISTLTPEK